VPAVAAAAASAAAAAAAGGVEGARVGVDEYLQLEHEDDWYLIFEDDAQISTRSAGGTKRNDFQSILFQTLKYSLPAEWDICYLGCMIPHNCKKYYHKNLVKPSYVWEQHAYVLKGRAVEKILGSLPISAPVDNFISQLITDGILVVSTVHMRSVFVHTDTDD
jgi:hypothetical protein